MILDLYFRKTVVVGAGYIAVELAGILNALGSDVSLLIRYDHVRTCLFIIIKDQIVHACYSGIHTPCPCVFWPSRHNIRDIELKFCIFS